MKKRRNRIEKKYVIFEVNGVRLLRLWRSGVVDRRKPHHFIRFHCGIWSRVLCLSYMPIACVYHSGDECFLFE